VPRLIPAAASTLVLSTVRVFAALMATARAVIYSRISHDPHDRQLGVERQEQDCLRLISARGWELACPPFRENDTSASTRSSAKRPVYEAMLAQLQAGVAEMLVCHSTSRLTRRPLDYERLIRLTQDRGVRIATVVSGAVDLATADGRVIARVLAALDAAEAERIGERISRACRQRAELGEWHGGPRAPFGYRLAPSAGKQVLVVVPEAAALVREAAARVLAGDSLYRIRQDWNSRGLTSGAGLPWRSQGIKRCLVRGAVAGLSERGGELFPGSWPAILYRTTWDNVRGVLLDPSRDTRTFVQRSALHPLTGLLWCGRCGHLLRSSTAQGVLSYYCADALGGCARIRVKSEDVERYLLEELAGRVAAGVVTAVDDPVLVALRLQQHQLQDDHYDHLLDRDDYLRQAARLAGRVADRRRELTGGWQRAHVAPLPVTATPGDEPARRRAALRHHLERVEVDPHPRGRGTGSGSGWDLRRRVVAARLRPTWHDTPAATSPAQPEEAGVQVGTRDGSAASPHPAAGMVDAAALWVSPA
jgi:site-specific DNA recombinase